MTNPENKIIVALDFATSLEALRLIERVRDRIDFFKIGLQLYTAAGPKIVRTVIESGAKVFLDLKLNDIPNTVSGVVSLAGELSVRMLSIHLSGGRAMLEAAVSAKRSQLALLGVTVLTSADEMTLRETGINSGIEEQVERLAKLAAAAGIDGVIASPHETKMLRACLGEKIKIVTPGVRPSWSQPYDQKRFLTPKEAIQNGADYLVIGRPITGHKNPLEAVQRILEEIGG